MRSRFLFLFFTRGTGELVLLFLLRQVGVVVDFGNVVQIVEHVEDLLEALQVVARGIRGVLRDHADLGGNQGVLALQRGADRIQIVGLGGDFEHAVVQRAVGSARFQRIHHHFVLVQTFCLDQDHALAVEHPGDAAGRTHGSAVLFKAVAHIGRGTVEVIRDALDDNRGAGRAVTLVGDFLVVFTLTFARRLLDGAVDVVVGHVVVFRLGDDIAELGVQRRVGAARPDGDGDLAADLGEDLASGSVRLALLHLNIMPLGMSGHT